MSKKNAVIQYKDNMDQSGSNQSKSQEAKVSIVVPTYKRSHKIRNTIESILRQTYHNYEIIIVDDNNADSSHKQKTRDVVSDYIHLGNIFYFSNDQNLGACASRNIGINASAGEYVAFIDDDDLWLSFKLEDQISLLTCNPSADFCYCDLFLVNGGSSYAQIISWSFDTNNLFSDLLKNGDGICTSALVAKKSSLVSIGGFDPVLRSFQDFDLLLKLSSKFKSVSVQKPLLLYRVDSDGISLNTLAKYYGKSQILTKYRQYYFKLGIISSYSHQLSTAADYALISGLRVEAIRLIFGSLSSQMSIKGVIKLVLMIIIPPKWYKMLLGVFARLIQLRGQ